MRATRIIGFLSFGICVFIGCFELWRRRNRAIQPKSIIPSISINVPSNNELESVPTEDIDENQNDQSKQEEKENDATSRNITVLQSLWRRKQVQKLMKKTAPKLKRRKNIANEILTTEQSYVGSLHLVHEIYIQPLSKDNTVLSNDKLHLIFSNWEHMLHLHDTILPDLVRKIAGDNWYPYQQIGAVFLKNITDLKSYYTQYVLNYDKSIETLREAIESNERFEQFLEEASKDRRCNFLHLSDFLIMPVQRLPRYEMLLTDLFKHTPEDAEDYSALKQCNNELKQVNQFINEQKKQMQSMKRIFSVQSKVRGKDKPAILLRPGRTILKEGILIQLDEKTKSEKEVYCFLFNDMLMISKRMTAQKREIDLTLRYDFKVTIPLEGASITDIHDLNSSPGVNSTESLSSPALSKKNRKTVRDASNPNSSPAIQRFVEINTNTVFQVTDKDGKKYYWRTENAMLKKGWFNAIEQAIQNVQ